MCSGLYGNKTTRYLLKYLFHRFRYRRHFLFQKDFARFIQNAVVRPAITEGQPSKFLIAKLVELERELESLVASLRGARTDAIETPFRDTRKFVELRLKDLGMLLNAEPRLARAAIANHVQKIEMTPDGKTYVASGTWDLLGGGSGAVSMVPGARIELATPAFSGRRSTTELPRH